MTAAIDKLQQLDEDELDALIELAQARANSSMTKRDFLKAAGVLGTGAVLGGGAASELTGDAQAAASTTDGDGDIGTPANPEDVYADALAVFDGANNQIGSFDETGIETPSVNTDDVSIGPNSEIRFAADDAELDTKLSNAADGELIILGNAEFSTNRTVSNQLTFLGTSQTGPDISGTWTLNDTQIVLRGLGISGTIEMDNILCKIKGCNLFEASINVNADRCGVVNGCSDGAVTFASGTSGGLADSLIDTSVTDNGSNTVGDIG